MKTILVTGGAGYVGSHACKALAQAGFTPVTYDNLSRGHAWAVKWGPLERGDLADVERLQGVLARYRPDAVLHFAGLAYVPALPEERQQVIDRTGAEHLAGLERQLERRCPQVSEEHVEIVGICSGLFG